MGRKRRKVVIHKYYDVDFFGNNNCQSKALTLPQSFVTNNNNLKGGLHTRTHDSGWTITGKLL